jgi:hypothetical protein
MPVVLLPVALLVACAGLVGVEAADGGAFSMRPGMPILGAGALVAALRRGRTGALVGLVAAGFVAIASLRSELPRELTGDAGIDLAATRWVELVGLAAAIVVAVATLVPRSSQPTESAEGRRTLRGREWGRAGQVGGVLVLCAVGAELLAAYGDTTGDPAGIAFALVFFGALYGAPALLARELVRRLGWGWPSLLLVFGALGVAQACLIDQSMFSVDYQGYEGWEQTREATLVPGLGVSAYNAYNFVVGHVIYSFAAPIALVEAWRPERAREPWLGIGGIVLAAAAYVGAAVLILADPESRSGSSTQLTVAALLALALLGAAAVLGRRSSMATDGTAGASLRVWSVLGGATVGALLANLFPENWLGFAAGVAATTAVGLAMLVAARRTRWSPRHAAAVGLAFLLVRGVLAFTYFPLTGDVAPGPKYAHNVVMLVVILVAGWLALRTPLPTRAEATPPTALATPTVTTLQPPSHPGARTSPAQGPAPPPGPAQTK